MQNDPYTFIGGMRNVDATTAQERAITNWAINTMYMKTPANKHIQMATAVAHVQPEESLHNEWDASIINTVAHLELAANDAIEQALTSPDNSAGIDTSYLEIINTIRHSLKELLIPMQPFIEAADKFQVLTVLNGDSTIEKAFKNFHKEEYGEDAAEEFLDKFRDRLEAEMDRVQGKEASSEATNPYVNPLYFYALSDIATTDWESNDGQAAHAEEATYNPVGRSIAEIVARVTLDVPNPIAPLGCAEFPDFKPLSADVEVEPKSVSELLNDPRYTLTEEDYDNYLGVYVDEIQTDDWDLGFQDAKSSWVARVFVKVLQALEALAEDEQIALAELDSDKLRRLLVQRVHDVDPHSTKTMHDYPTVMFDIPRQADSVSQSADIMSQKGPPLAKILDASFEQDRSFAAVVYNLTEEERKYEMNWHVKDDSFDLSQYQHVPDKASVFADVWYHYYVWDELRRFIGQYPELLIDKLLQEYGDRGTDELNDRLEELNTDPTAADNVTYTPDTSPRASEGKFANVDAYQLAKKGKVRKELLSLSLPELITLARDLDLAPEQLDFSDIGCPICEIRTGTCGDDGECRWADEISLFAEHFSTIFSTMH